MQDVQIHMMASGWDEDMIVILNSLPIPFWNFFDQSYQLPTPQACCQKAKRLPLIFSTSMADMETVETAYALISTYNDCITSMQCTLAYPSIHSDIHLNVISTFQKRIPNAIIGYSGHEIYFNYYSSHYFEGKSSGAPLYFGPKVGRWRPCSITGTRWPCKVMPV